MSIKDWSTTAGSNTDVDGVNIAEGCAPGTINNAIRAVMADVRSFYAGGGWVDLGYACTYASSTSFTVGSDVTALYPVDQRVKVTGATTGTIYGTITASGYSAPNTTVTVSFDSGSLQSETLTVYTSFMTVTGSPVSTGDVTGPASATDSAVALFDGTGGKTLKDGVAIASGSGSLLRTDGDGSGLSGIADTVARDMAAASLAAQLVTTDLTSAGLVSELGNLKLVDDFRSDSLATSTNATYDGTNDWYTNAGSSTQIAYNTGTVIGDMTAGGGIAAAFDNVTSQASASVSRKATTAGYVGKDWGGGTTKTIVAYKVYGPNNNTFSISTGGTVTLTLYGSNSVPANSTDGTSLHSASADNSSSAAVQDITSGVTTSTAYRYHWVAYSTTGTECGIAEVQFFETGAATNMTLRPTAETITTGAQDVLGYFLYDPVDSVTLGTDFVGKVSIDGGSTWETASLTSVGNIGSTGVIMIKAEADVSGQSGTSLTYSVETANSKELRYTGCVGLIPLY